MDQIAILMPLVAGITATVFTIVIHSLALTDSDRFRPPVSVAPTLFCAARPPSSGLVPENCTAFRIGVAIVAVAVLPAKIATSDYRATTARPTMFNKRKVRDFIGGADADRTRDLLNAIHLTSAAHTKPAQQIPRNTGDPAFLSWAFLVLVARGFRTKFGQFSDGRAARHDRVTGVVSWLRTPMWKRVGNGMNVMPISFSANATGR